MTATELTTREWIESQGYFSMSSVKFGRSEVDLLAIRQRADSSFDRLHIEVTVSPRPFGSKRSLDLYEKDVDDYFKKKFADRRADVLQILKGEYESWLVLGKLAGGKEEEELWKRRMEEHNVKVIRFEDVVRDYVKRIRVRPTGMTGDLLDTLNHLGLLKKDGEA